MIPASGGVQVAADVYGHSGPLVILQHGGGQTRHAWKGAGQKLAEAGYLAVSLDARGHGDSDWAPDGDYSTDSLVEDLVAIVEHLGQRPILVGASMGGGTSLTAVGEARVAAEALVLVDTAPQIEIGGVRKIRNFMGQAPDGFTSLEEVAEAISNYQPHRKRSRNLEGLAKNVRLWPDGRYRWHWDPEFMRRKGSIADRVRRQEEAAKNIGCPSLLVRGGLSDVLSEEGAQAYLELVPHSEYANVGDAAHMVAGDRNDVFVSSVLSFLSKVAPSN
ncbi:MAG: alpha/beta hydrolase [Acidimicrobiales bacterium]|nr:alpha/beta hydrolase [Acidimicrobiaceae bacterium]MBA4812599.1 alpha/beta hydrolase [Acidimicrobiales bacterium]RPH17833.1 MAG: alpha/beta hydrolase [Actinobacteria bacterium TMED270]|tara:strand:+ start:674 stop:1498 length:825 start_codon:yes stop_codon:yes gene_type:complete